MLLDYILYKKNHITVSEEGAGSMTGLQTVHTIKSPSNDLWTVDGTPSSAWIKLNLYTINPIDQISLTYSGTLTSIIIEASNDNYNWDVLNSAFTPADTTITLTYTNKNYVFLRITIVGPSSFALENLAVYGEITFENKDFISHANDFLFPQNYRDNYPFIPSINKTFLEMLEGKNDINLKLFDETVFSSTSVGISNVSDTITLTPSNVPLVTGAHYIWDFDDVVYNWEASKAYTSGFFIFENGYIWECTTGGTSDSTEPTWAYVTATIDPWRASINYSEGDTIYEDGSVWYLYSDSGSSGSTEPDWTTSPNLNDTIADDGVNWRRVTLGLTIYDNGVVWTKRTKKYLSDNNPLRIVTTTAPAVVSYTYHGDTGTYQPRLIIKTDDYQLEWIKQYIKS